MVAGYVRYVTISNETVMGYFWPKFDQIVKDGYKISKTFLSQKGDLLFNNLSHTHLFAYWMSFFTKLMGIDWEVFSPVKHSNTCVKKTVCLSSGDIEADILLKSQIPFIKILII